MKSYKKYFWDVIKKQYADFKGVATRKQYWMFQLYGFLTFFLPMLLLILGWGLFAFLSDASGVKPSLSPVMAIIFMIFSVILLIGCFAIFVPSLAMSVRRLHDIKMSGWALLINLLPYVGGLILFVFYLLPSETENNKYRLEK
ncbi:MAG: DUF805 domain-containing protein [Candidatus Nomurabacteria bacterium]